MARKQLKIIKDKAENSCGRGKNELTQDYKSYADYAFPNDETRHPRCENAADSVFVHQVMMNVSIPTGNVYLGSVLTSLLWLSQELKLIYQNEHQCLRLTCI